MKKAKRVRIIAIVAAMVLAGCGAKADAVAQKMIDDIDALGDISIEDEEEVNKLINRYSTLTDFQKETVKNYAALIEAQDQIELLKQEQVEEQEKREKELLAEENVQACLKTTRKIREGLKHPDTLEIKRILNHDYVSDAGVDCTEFYIEYEAANDLGGMVSKTVFAIYQKNGRFEGSVLLYSRDDGKLNEDYDIKASHWSYMLENEKDEVKEIDVTVIQNNM